MTVNTAPADTAPEILPPDSPIVVTGNYLSMLIDRNGSDKLFSNVHEQLLRLIDPNQQAHVDVWQRLFDKILYVKGASAAFKFAETGFEATSDTLLERASRNGLGACSIAQMENALSRSSWNTFDGACVTFSIYVKDDAAACTKWSEHVIRASEIFGPGIAYTAAERACVNSQDAKLLEAAKNVQFPLAEAMLDKGIRDRDYALFKKGYEAHVIHCDHQHTSEKYDSLSERLNAASRELGPEKAYEMAQHISRNVQDNRLREVAEEARFAFAGEMLVQGIDKRDWKSFKTGYVAYSKHCDPHNTTGEVDELRRQLEKAQVIFAREQVRSVVLASLHHIADGTQLRQGSIAFLANQEGFIHDSKRPVPLTSWGRRVAQVRDV